MSIPRPLKEFLQHLRKLGFTWPLDPAPFPNPNYQGTFVRRGTIVIRVIFNISVGRFFLAKTDRMDAQEAFFENDDPHTTAKKVRSFFP